MRHNPHHAVTDPAVVRSLIAENPWATIVSPKVKMSQDKDPKSQAGVLAELRGDGPYADAALAADMERALEG